MQSRGHQVDPWPKKIPHAAGQVSPCAPTTGPTHHNHRGHTTQPPKPHTTPTEAHTPQHRGHTPQHQSHTHNTKATYTTVTKATPQHRCPQALSLSPTARDATAVRSLHTAARGIPESPRVEKTLHVSGDPALPTMCKYLKPSFLTHRGLSDFPLGEQGKGSETQLPPWRAAVRGVREPDSAERLNRNRQRQEQPLTARPSGPGTGARSRGHAGTAWAGPSLREPGIQPGTDRLLSTKQGRVRPGL